MAMLDDIWHLTGDILEAVLEHVEYKLGTMCVRRRMRYHPPILDIFATQELGEFYTTAELQSASHSQKELQRNFLPPHAEPGTCPAEKLPGELWNLIIELLEPGHLIQLAQTCRSLRAIVKMDWHTMMDNLPPESLIPQLGEVALTRPGRWWVCICCQRLHRVDDCALPQETQPPPRSKLARILFSKEKKEKPFPTSTLNPNERGIPAFEHDYFDGFSWNNIKMRKYRYRPRHFEVPPSGLGDYCDTGTRNDVCSKFLERYYHGNIFSRKDNATSGHNYLAFPRITEDDRFFLYEERYYKQVASPWGGGPEVRPRYQRIPLDFGIPFITGCPHINVMGICDVRDRRHKPESSERTSWRPKCSRMMHAGPPWVRTPLKWFRSSQNCANIYMKHGGLFSCEKCLTSYYIHYRRDCTGYQVCVVRSWHDLGFSGPAPPGAYEHPLYKDRHCGFVDPVSTLDHFVKHTPGPFRTDVGGAT